jgi:hypothetical protein
MNMVVPNSPDGLRPDRLIVSNILEWGIQPERRDLPEHTPPPVAERFAPEDMALYWSGDRKIVVTRHAMDALHVEDCRAILGYESVACRALRVEKPGNSICADLAADERGLADLVELLDYGPGDGPISVEACASTPEYARLVACIRKRSKRLISDRMTPEPYLEFVPVLDSKIRARELFFAALPLCSSMRLTRAFTTRRETDLLKYVQCALSVLGPAIVKTDFGAGGHSMAVIESAGSLGDKNIGFLSAGYDEELLVEEYLGSGEDALAVSYNGMVEEDGEISTLGAGRHFLYADRFYIGSYLGIGSVPPGCADRIRWAGEAIGKVVASFGYRGPLNIDFIYRKSDAAIFPLEINPRRTLGASLAEICIHLFGHGYDAMVSAVAKRRVPVHPSVTKYGELRDFLMRKGLFGRETKGLLVLPYMVSSLASNSIIGLIVVGMDGVSAEAAFSEITHYLAQEAGR